MALLVTIFLMLVNISTTEHYKGPVVSNIAVNLHFRTNITHATDFRPGF